MTPFDKIIDLALVTIDDYKIVKAYQQGEEVFKNWCDGFLLRAVPYFTKCRQSLDYDVEKREFSSDLTTTEISILADLFKIQWYERERNDATKINALLQPSGGFKTHSAGQNLKEKTATIDGLNEELSRRLTEYQLEDLANINI